MELERIKMFPLYEIYDRLNIPVWSPSFQLGPRMTSCGKEQFGY